MKRLFSIFFFVITVLSSFAQVKPDSSKHLSFKGVPIDGTLNEFVLKMKKGGFTHTGTEEGLAVLKGDFASYKSCVIGVSTLKTKDLVSKIVVLFPERDTWSSLSSNYFTLKEMLTEKYGDPSDCVEKFQSYSEPKNDNDKMFEVKFDKCKYLTIYETEKGSIQLSIDHDGVMRCMVKLA
ncbi:MAG: hypothetical protein J7599_07885 [Niabella sp.]|nr:hypothetical protein [Niabella sp.]